MRPASFGIRHFIGHWRGIDQHFAVHWRGRCKWCRRAHQLCLRQSMRAARSGSSFRTLGTVFPQHVVLGNRDRQFGLGCLGQYAFAVLDHRENHRYCGIESTEAASACCGVAVPNEKVGFRHAWSSRNYRLLHGGFYLRFSCRILVTFTGCRFNVRSAVNGGQHRFGGDWHRQRIWQFGSGAALPKIFHVQSARWSISEYACWRWCAICSPQNRGDVVHFSPLYWADTGWRPSHHPPDWLAGCLVAQYQHAVLIPDHALTWWVRFGRLSWRPRRSIYPQF